ncbi:hypothetical protein Tco_0337678 [Tanacetum coccineum]
MSGAQNEKSQVLRTRYWLLQVRESKVENQSEEMLRDLDQQMEKRADDDAAESVRDAIGFEYYLASSTVGYSDNDVRLMDDLMRAPHVVIDFWCMCHWMRSKVDKTLRFVEEPIEIMDREIKKLKHGKITLVKVIWNLKRGPEFTWEHADQMRIRYPQLFVDRVIEPASKSRDEISSRRGYCDTRDLGSACDWHPLYWKACIFEPLHIDLSFTVGCDTQVQRLMDAHLAPTQPIQVNKITTLVEVCSDPHGTLSIAWEGP